MAPFAPPALPTHRPYTKKGLPRKRPGPAPKPKHELAKWKNKKPLQRVERSYPLERKIEVLMFLLNHRITETEPPQRAPRRRLGQPPECEATYSISETGQRLYHRAPTYAEASAWYKVPMPTIHGWWDNREKILEGTGVELPKVLDTLPVPDWLNKPLEKDGPQYQANNATPSQNPSSSANSTTSTTATVPPAVQPSPAQTSAPRVTATPAASNTPTPLRPAAAPPVPNSTPVPNQTPTPAARPPQNPVPVPFPVNVPQPIRRPIPQTSAPPSAPPAPVQIVFSLKGGHLPQSVPPKPFPGQAPGVSPAALQNIGPPYVQTAPPPPNAGLIPPLDLPTIPWSVYAGPSGPIPLAHPPPPQLAHRGPIPQPPQLTMTQMRTKVIPKATKPVSPGPRLLSQQTTPTHTPAGKLPSVPTPAAVAATAARINGPVPAAETPDTNGSTTSKSDEMEVDGSEESLSLSTQSPSTEAANPPEVTMSN